VLHSWDFDINKHTHFGASSVITSDVFCGIYFLLRLCMTALFTRIKMILIPWMLVLNFWT